MASESEDIVVARGLSKSFGKRQVVCDIDFNIKAGRCYGFLGPNGAGKTTILSLIEGLSPINSGSLSVFGYKMPQQGKIARARMGIVPQMDNLDPDFSVIHNLRIYGSYFRIPKAILETRIHDLLDFMQLSDRVNDKPDDLSGGMKRRLVIARALINDPDLIILDEPTTGLDPQVRHLIWAQLRNLMQQGKTILLTTHYMDEAERLCDELFLMDHGKILDQGSPLNIIDRHVEKHVVEIRGGYHEIEQCKSQLSSIKSIRMEVHADTLFCYTENIELILNELAEHLPDQLMDHPTDKKSMHTIRRSTNLEDVFLKLTGRELRE